MKIINLFIISFFLFSSSCSSTLILPQDSLQKVNIEVNAKVLRSFYKTYGEVNGAKWIVTNNGYAVGFSNKGIQTLAHYKNSGERESWVLNYGEKNLAPSIRHLVKSNFYDYTITHVTEVHKNEAMAYFVKIENKTTITTLKIVEGEWEIAETIIKRG